MNIRFFPIFVLCLIVHDSIAHPLFHTIKNPQTVQQVAGLALVTARRASAQQGIFNQQQKRNILVFAAIPTAAPAVKLAASSIVIAIAAWKLRKGPAISEDIPILPPDIPLEKVVVATSRFKRFIGTIMSGRAMHPPVTPPQVLTDKIVSEASKATFATAGAALKAAGPIKEAVAQVATVVGATSAAIAPAAEAALTGDAAVAQAFLESLATGESAKLAALLGKSQTANTLTAGASATTTATQTTAAAQATTTSGFLGTGLSATTVATGAVVAGATVWAGYELWQYYNDPVNIEKWRREAEEREAFLAEQRKPGAPFYELIKIADSLSALPGYRSLASILSDFSAKIPRDTGCQLPIHDAKPDSGCRLPITPPPTPIHTGGQAPIINPAATTGCGHPIQPTPTPLILTKGGAQKTPDKPQTSNSPEDKRMHGAQAPGKPTEVEGYVPPKKWDGQKVVVQKGRFKGRYGWPDNRGNIWVPSGPNGHGCPHWDVQYPDGSYDNVVPGGRIRGQK